MAIAIVPAARGRREALDGARYRL